MRLNYSTGILWTNHIYSRNQNDSKVSIIPSIKYSNRIFQNTWRSKGLSSEIYYKLHCFSKKSDVFDSIKKYVLSKKQEYYAFIEI